MKQKNHLGENEIDLTDLLKKVWQRKILILTISLFGLIVDLTFLIKNNNLYNISDKLLKKSTINEVSIELPSEDFFKFYGIVYYEINKKKLHIDFKERLISNLSSHNNLSNFIEKSSDANNLKNFLKKKKLTLSQYLIETNEKKLTINQVNENLVNFFLVLPHEAKNDNFLGRYIDLTYDNTIKEILPLIKLTLLKKIDNLENSLILKEKKNKEILNFFIIQKSLTIDEINQANAEILRRNIGEFIYTQNIISDTKKILDNFQAETNFFFEKKPIKFKINESKINRVPLKGLFLGFFGSLLVIFFIILFYKK